MGLSSGPFTIFVWQLDQLGFKLTRKMNSKVYSEPLCELHWEETWHLHFVTYLYYHLRKKCTALHHVSCWRNERSRKLLEQNLLDCERHGEYRHIILLLPFTMLKHLSLNIWLLWSGRNIAWEAEYWREKKNLWNSLANPNMPFFFLIKNEVLNINHFITSIWQAH